MEISQVIKRNGKKASYDRSRIENAITSASVNEGVYLSKEEIEKVVDEVEKLAAAKCKEAGYVSVDDIQDYVVRELSKQGHSKLSDLYQQFRVDRDEARAVMQEGFKSFIKKVEDINESDVEEDDSKRENANVDANTSMGTMLQYGTTLSKEYAIAYLLNREQRDAHLSGDIHIHDLDFMASNSTTTCMQIPISKLFKGGFNTGHGMLREPTTIQTAAQLTAIAIQANQNEQHGGVRLC